MKKTIEEMTTPELINEFRSECFQAGELIGKHKERRDYSPYRVNIDYIDSLQEALCDRIPTPTKNKSVVGVYTETSDLVDELLDVTREIERMEVTDNDYHGDVNRLKGKYNHLLMKVKQRVFGKIPVSGVNTTEIITVEHIAVYPDHVAIRFGNVDISLPGWVLNDTELRSLEEHERKVILAMRINKLFGNELDV